MRIGLFRGKGAQQDTCPIRRLAIRAKIITPFWLSTHSNFLYRTGVTLEIRQNVGARQLSYCHGRRIGVNAPIEYPQARPVNEMERYLDLSLPFWLGAC